MQTINSCLIVASILFLFAPDACGDSRQPNVLFFALDDLNDWVGALGHEQAITPNMDRLARSGVNFINAHTAGVFCAPSRSAIFTGQYACTTGCYTTQVYFQNHPQMTPLQKVLQEGGYVTFGAGKLFHHPAGFIDQRGWDQFFLRSAEQRRRGWPLESWTVDDPALPNPYPNSIFNHDREPANGFFMEWGKVLNENEGKMADTIRTEWACDLLRQQHDKPFFVAVGLYAPHFPNYAPEKYFDLYDPDKIELPPYRADDLEDLPPKVRKAKEARAAHHRRLESLDALDDAIHGYLACISYADAMLGRLLEAIESGPNADNTIVVLWSDHGYHHGEKFDWGKHTLWERTSNVPFIWAGPGIKRGANVSATVSLIDILPTLTDLCGVPDQVPREGVSLAPVLAEPSTARDRAVLLPGMEPGEYAMMNENWRYIHYADDTEELYDVRSDPHEWNNLAPLVEFRAVKQTLRAVAPREFAAPGPSRKDNKLVIEGEDFHWVAKRQAAPKLVSDSVRGARMTPLETSPEAEMDPIRIQGRSAWKSALRPGKPTYFYFELENPNFRRGKQPAVQVVVTYLDQGNEEVIVQYDSSDPSVNASHPMGPGAFKEATRFRTSNTNRWRKAIFDVKDAHFAGRCNGCDLRVVFASPAAEPVVARVVVKPLE